MLNIIIIIYIVNVQSCVPTQVNYPLKLYISVICHIITHGQETGWNDVRSPVNTVW